ncbi:rRNA maturation RNase YbeY [Asticcacaulis sp. EMRT-3]|uniref:rRNA maturation RNase YbeY n=1 Tax=Asticcacaulis sp. EMRT-3 TaxID=3040349 RepID=UPI0024AFFCBC|nr:rRNA maturation RNase YbeY [Asticcacaulis sp. EMRT-3]MDI7775680.1 rRNA maturation RNase YbeY [Asticcacaulis sp. EMRT-3]
MIADPLIDIEIEEEGWLDVLPDVREVVEAGIAAALKAVELSDQADVVVLLCDDAEMQRLNAEYRQKNAPTNVLSFPAPKAMQKIGPGMTHLGDMALGLETCVREAGEQGKSLKNHVLHLSVHGALHLLGYDHIRDDEAEEMEALERTILSSLSVSDPYSDTPYSDNGHDA